MERSSQHYRKRNKGTQKILHRNKGATRTLRVKKAALGQRMTNQGGAACQPPGRGPKKERNRAAEGKKKTKGTTRDDAEHPLGGKAFHSSSREKEQRKVA